MIGKLKGKISDLKPAELVLYVNEGVGYEVFIPFSTYEKISTHEYTELFIYTLHKEDQLKLFGFATKEEKDLFAMLLNISGIGPSMALSILSGIQTELLIEAVNEGNSVLLTRVPGIGKNKAEKLIFELKRKIRKLELLAPSRQKKPSARNDALEALISLGYDEISAKKSVDEIMKANNNMTVEDLVKNALKQLSSA